MAERERARVEVRGGGGAIFGGYGKRENRKRKEMGGFYVMSDEW